MARSDRPHTGRWLFASSALLAVLVAPFALADGEGAPLKGGTRNPSPNASSAYTAETQIIADNGTYGTRQSNKGSGGGAIYGCRSAVGSEPCIRANNLDKGRAFEFDTNGAEGGQISAQGGDNARPFTTNATGVATGLNADRVDSKNADEISSDGAKSALSAVQAAVRFANVDGTGKLLGSRGVASVDPGTAGDGSYKVVFQQDVTACTFSAVQTATEDAGATGIGLGSDGRTVTVVTRAGGGTAGTDPTLPADRPFDLVATCL